MRSLLGLAFTLVCACALTCPELNKEMEGRCIRSIWIEQTFFFPVDLPYTRAKCAEDGAHLPIIRSEEDNQAFNRIMNTSDYLRGRDAWLVLDLTCNPSTRRLEWIDGTPVDYVPEPKVDLSFDCVTQKNTAISEVERDKWRVISTADNYKQSVLCVIEANEIKPPVLPQCGDYSLMETYKGNEKPCIKVFTKPMSWDSAQRACAADFGSLLTIDSDDENKYFWRTAVSNNIQGGIHIGAHQSKSDSSKWTWIDVEVPIKGHYDNFISAFPIPGAGECSAMLTESSTAQWINEDCDDSELPFICRRADSSVISKQCPKEAPPAVEDFYPPGFPNSDTPCEYVLFVAAKKLVELEITSLVADAGKDFLEVIEGPAGLNLLANLTGTILTPTTYKTSKSNVLRVNWKPAGSGDGRGFRIRYNEIDA